MLGNKEIMAHNIKKYMSIKGVTSADVCRALNFKTNTFSNWITAKIYPRIDKIEMLAAYFGISKAALVEDSDNIVLSSPDYLSCLFHGLFRVFVYCALYSKFSDNKIRAARHYPKTAPCKGYR